MKATDCTMTRIDLYKDGFYVEVYPPYGNYENYEAYLCNGLQEHKMYMFCHPNKDIEDWKKMIANCIDNHNYMNLYWNEVSALDEADEKRMEGLFWEEFDKKEEE